MNAACKKPDWDQPSTSRANLVVAAHADTATAPSEQATLIYDVLKEVAECTSYSYLLNLMRQRGPDLVQAFGEIHHNGNGHRGKAPALDVQLRARGVRRTILDNLEMAELNYRRGVRIYNDIRSSHEPDDVPVAVMERMTECWKAQYQHLFGWTFLALIAAGFIDQDAPGVDHMLVFMREASLSVYANAAVAEEDLRAAAA